MTKKPSVFREGTSLSLIFLGEIAKISLETGRITISGRDGTFSESLCLYDWLCDGKSPPPSRQFAPVSSLPGVLVRGNGLTIGTEKLAMAISADPPGFCRACQSLGGRQRALGDLGFEIPLFADLTMLLKYYDADEEFPPSCLLLWDTRILEYIRYETVYYLAACLLARLTREMERPSGDVSPSQSEPL